MKESNFIKVLVVSVLVFFSTVQVQAAEQMFPVDFLTKPQEEVTDTG